MNRAVDPTAVVVGKTRLELPEGPFELDIVEGTERERAVDIRKLRATSGYITLDDGFTNTGSCASNITFIDGEKGMLRYRGFPIEQIAKHCTFSETAFLLINGQPPKARELKKFSELLTEHALLHEGLRYHFEGFPPDAHPMAILSAMINSTSADPDRLNTTMPMAAEYGSKIIALAMDKNIPATADGRVAEDVGTLVRREVGSHHFVRHVEVVARDRQRHGQPRQGHVPDPLRVLRPRDVDDIQQAPVGGVVVGDVFVQHRLEMVQ